MVTCPQCGESATIEIAPHHDRSRELTSAGSVARWAATCADCGSSWTLTDLV